MTKAIGEANDFGFEEFTALLSGVVEHSPILAAGLWSRRPFKTRKHLHEELCDIMDSLPHNDLQRKFYNLRRVSLSEPRANPGPPFNTYLPPPDPPLQYWIRAWVPLSPMDLDSLNIQLRNLQRKFYNLRRVSLSEPRANPGPPFNTYLPPPDPPLQYWIRAWVPLSPMDLDSLNIQLRRKEGVLRVHPDLAGRLADAGKLTSHSTHEQNAAGLFDITPEQKDFICTQNKAYKEKFNFPFVICARENKAAAIMKGLSERISRDPHEECLAGFEEVKKIAFYRLTDIIKEEVIDCNVNKPKENSVSHL